MPWGYDDSYDDNSPWWSDSINRGIDVLGAYASRSPYYSPNDPRYQQGQGAWPPVYSPQVYPPSQYNQSLIPGAVSAQGVQINWWTALLIGGLVGAFLFGRRSR